MKPFSRVLKKYEFEDHAFLHQQEDEVMREIAISMAGRKLLQEDKNRLTRHRVIDGTGVQVIFWDGVRKGILYSGPELDKKHSDNTAPVWLMFYVPEEELQ